MKWGPYRLLEWRGEKKFCCRPRKRKKVSCSTAGPSFKKHVRMSTVDRDRSGGRPWRVQEVWWSTVALTAVDRGPTRKLVVDRGILAVDRHIAAMQMGGPILIQGVLILVPSQKLLHLAIETCSKWNF
jgi:hypothetical protein